MSRSTAPFALIALLAITSSTRAFAATTYSTSFEAAEGYSTTFDPDGAALFYAPGSINTQPNPGSPDDSWFENSNAGVHGEIAITPVVPAIPPGLGTQSLHFYDRSDTVLIPSPGFGASTPNQSPIVDAAGETGSFTQGANAATPGAHARTTNSLQAEWWFKANAANLASDQIFLNLSLGTRDTGGVGPSRRYADGFLAQSTNPGKFNMLIQEIDGTDPNDFELTATSADLNRDEWYRMVLSAVLVDGLAGDGSSNDIVTLSAFDTLGNLQASISGRSMEVGYKYSSAGVLRPGSDAWSNGIAINAFGYRLGSSVTPDEIGYLDKLTLISGVPEPSTIVLGVLGVISMLRLPRRRGK